MALNRLKAGGRGLQPVPEESAANGTAADAHPDAAAASVNPSEQCVKNSDGTYTNNGNAIADRRLRRWFSEDATAERHPPDNVPEKEYRIWFPRTEVSDEDPTGRASSDWRTFREYRYTECSRAGRLEKTLSVDEVFNSNDSPRTTAVHPPTSAFHCVSCSNSDEVEGGPLDVAGEERCRMLSSTKSELYREHRSQLLSRLEDDVTSPWEASSLKTDKKPKLSEASADTGSEKEARTSVCQTSSKKFAFDDDNSKTSSSDIPSWNEGGLASAPAPRSLSGNENGSNSHQAVSAGPQDASLVSEDDDFDDSKCTYVKVDSVDSEVEDETGVGRETVIGAPSIDDLGYIAEEPEDDVEETTRDLGNQTSSANTTHEAAESERSCMMSSTAETSHQAPLSSKLGVKEAFKEAGERGNDLKFNESTLDTAVHLATDVNTLVGGKSLECHSDESKSVEQNAKQISHDHNEQKDIVEAALHHGNEEYTKQTLKTVSSILSDSPRRKNIVHDDVAHVLGDVKKRDKRLAEGGLKGPQEDTRQHFDDLALKNSHDFRDEGASHLHPAEMPNENVNKIQDTDVIAEDGSMADNKENVPMILPDEHHLFKQPEISSVEGNEGTGVARESNDELEIDNSEQGITQQSLAAHTVPEENSLSSSIKASMLKDVIALNRTDDATSFDDVSLQDDNDQGFESLPCDQTLDPEDLNEEQHVKDELDNAEKLLPAGDDDNIGADKLTALLDELAEHEKATPVSLQYDTGVQTTPTDVTDQNNEPVFEPKLRSLASNDDSDKEGSAQKCAHGIRSDENVHPAPSMSSDNEEQIVLSVQITGSKSGEISELASTEASVPNETSEESESEAPINRSTNDEVTVVKAETPVSEISETATSNEAGVQNETFEDFASEEPVSQSTGKIREETSTEQLAFTEARAQSNKYDQFANQRYPSHITDDKHDNNVNADASLSEFPQIAVIDELNVQSKTSDVLGSEESVNQSNANIEVIKVKAEASINELPKVVIPNEVSAQNTPEEFASGETACPTTSDSDVPKVKAEVSNSEDPKNVVSTEESERIETMEESASEVSVNENMNKMITRVEPDAPVSEFPETSLSSELSAERKTSDEFTSEEPVNLGTNNNEVTKVNAQASVSEMTEILVSNEERVYSTSEEFASEGTAHPNTSDIAITKVKAGTSFGEVPEIVVYDEASVRNEASEEPASEAPMNLSTNEETRVESDASVSDMPEIAVFNENSAENKTSGQLACEEYGKQNDNDDENTKVKIVTSVSELHEIIASNETTDQSKKSGEFASGEAARHSASDVANTEAKEGASTSEVSQTTIADEASMQSERSTKFGNEAHVSETTNENIAEAKADTSTELPKIILSNEASVRNKPTEGFISEEPVNQGSNNEEIAKADEEEVGSESTETIVPNEASVQVVGVETEFQIISDYEATKGPAETSTSVVPENIVSGEASLLSQTPEKFENEALGNDSPRDNAIPEVKSEASASELPFNEASVQSIASEEFANGESTQETNGVVEVATLKADVPISEVPEIAVSNEVILPKKSHEELKNNATVNESTNDNEVTEVMAGASVIELPEETVPNEASIGNEISDELTSNENVHQSNSDKGNGELRPDTAK
ncbi:hypothetical protein HPB49_002102 [Dermacentor silvarum]|uniref:Uncharacterized protein n=1 Tax=Dermacentor silvarum TaxID=543639 RepID=A0ACB8D233_DERSI|nr:hypothetical protein HPB49_002102 [Dermacentor silvarum]